MNIICTRLRTDKVYLKKEEENVPSKKESSDIKKVCEPYLGIPSWR